jgi:sulfur carrier protein
MTISVLVNGEPRALEEPIVLGALVARYGAATTGVAAALNEAVVPRSRWSATRLADGDRVEILTAVQGG